MGNLYITHRILVNGEVLVRAVDDNDCLIFGFRTRDYSGWMEQAKAWTPHTKIPVFQANRSIELERNICLDS